MSAAAPRTTFATSRLLEFCSQKELTAQTGHEPEDWPLMIVKELVDNSLDSCEESGVAPAIHAMVARGKIRVRDNGSGIPPETVTSILDFTTRTSSREAYVAPDRGRQGNAAKTIVAMPFALSGKEGHVEIVARGIRHDIVFAVDRIAQVPVIDYRKHRLEGASVRTGTIVTVHWPESALLRPGGCGAALFTDDRALRSPQPAPHDTCNLGGRMAARAADPSSYSAGLGEVGTLSPDLPPLVPPRRVRASARRLPDP
jgi:hypothetical protein